MTPERHDLSSMNGDGAYAGAVEDLLKTILPLLHDRSVVEPIAQLVQDVSEDLNLSAPLLVADAPSTRRFAGLESRAAWTKITQVDSLDNITLDSATSAFYAIWHCTHR